VFIAIIGSQAHYDFHESSLTSQGLIREASLKSDE